jgi:glucan phosphoethanolaminetransferase (alkaline phosphatase superfamily)
VPGGECDYWQGIATTFLVFSSISLGLFIIFLFRGFYNVCSNLYYNGYEENKEESKLCQPYFNILFFAIVPTIVAIIVGIILSYNEYVFPGALAVFFGISVFFLVVILFVILVFRDFRDHILNILRCNCCKSSADKYKSNGGNKVSIDPAPYRDDRFELT